MSWTRLSGAVVALIAMAPAAFAQQAVDFTFDILLDPTAGPYGPYESASGSFAALPAQGSLTYSVSWTAQQGGCLTALTANVPITDLTLTLNGSTVERGGTGTLGFSAQPGSGTCSGFFSQTFGFGDSRFSIGGLFDIAVPNWPAALSARDPLAAMLASSSFTSTFDGISCALPGLPVYTNPEQCNVQVAAAPVATVREPDTVTLLVLGLSALAAGMWQRAIRVPAPLRRQSGRHGSSAAGQSSAEV